MEELLYIEIPTPETDRVRTWLQTQWQPESGTSLITPDGLRLQFPKISTKLTTVIPELSIFVWSLQRTNYLKVFHCADQAIPVASQIIHKLTTQIRQQFPPTHPAPPDSDLSHQSIFAARENMWMDLVSFLMLIIPPIVGRRYYLRPRC
jgi:lycopene cyclase CruA